MKFKKFIDLDLYSNTLLVFPRGSRVYGTFDIESDYDYIVVVPDYHPDFKQDITEMSGTHRGMKCDFQIIKEKKWIQMIKDHDIVAIEGLFLPETEDIIGDMDHYRYMFHLNPWKLRQSLSKISSNSWVKCRKKLTVKEDYNLRIAQKSLFHSLRILMFGIQLLKKGKIDFDCANEILEQIKSVPYPTWGKYYVMFHDLHNSLQTQFRKLAPKPNV